MISEVVALLRLHDLEFGLDESQSSISERSRAEIERCRSEIDPALLAKYEQLKRHYGVGSVVEVQDNICSGCRISLPKTAADRLKSGVVFCEHCGRILCDPDHAYHFHY